MWQLYSFIPLSTQALLTLTEILLAPVKYEKNVIDIEISNSLWWTDKISILFCLYILSISVLFHFIAAIYLIASDQGAGIGQIRTLLLMFSSGHAAHIFKGSQM